MNNVKLGTHESVNESLETESVIIERSGHRRNANLKKAKQKMTKQMKQKGQEKIAKQLKQQQQKDAQEPKQPKKYEFVVCDKDKKQIKTFGETELQNAKDYAIDDKNAMYVLIVPEGETDIKKGKAIWARKDFVSDLEYANELRKVAKQAKESMEESKNDKVKISHIPEEALRCGEDSNDEVDMAYITGEYSVSIQMTRYNEYEIVGDRERVNRLYKDFNLEDYGLRIDGESMEESKELNEEWYRGCRGVKFIWHGEWGDPELEYDGKIFNYWDVEGVLWDMFLEDTDHVDSESGDPKVEKEFDKYVRRNCRNYLDDLIANGYFGESIKESVNENELLDAVEYSYGMDEEEAKALIATLDDKSKEELVRGWKQDAKAMFHEELNEGNEEFPHLSKCREFEVLKKNLSDEALKLIEAEIEDFQNNYMEAENVRDYEEKHDIANKGFPDAVLWYNGLITTEEFIDYARDVYDMSRQDNMEESLKLVTSIGDYVPWGGAIEHWKELQREGYTQMFEDYMESIFPEGITMTQLNDALWFDWDEIREDLGMPMDESLKEDVEEEETGKRDVMVEIRDIYQNGDLYFDVTEDDFVIFDDWKSVIELEKALKPDFEPRDKWDDSVLDELGVNYGFSDEWASCGECGKAIRTAPNSYSWKPDFFVDYDAGYVICGDDVRKNPTDYINWLLESPASRANTILSNSGLESEGFEKVSEEYESGWYDRNDDPKKILAAAEEEYPNGEFIFSISRQGQFATNFELWMRRSDEYEESLKEEFVKSNMTIEELKSLVDNVYNGLKNLPKPEESSIGGEYYGGARLSRRVSNVLEIVTDYVHTQRDYYDSDRSWSGGTYCVKIGGAYDSSDYKDLLKPLEDAFNYRTGRTDILLIDNIRCQYIHDYGTAYSVYGIGFTPLEESLTEDAKEDIVTFEKKDEWLEEKGFADRFYFDGVDLVDKNTGADTDISVGKNGVQSDFLEKKISEYVTHKDDTNERAVEESLKEPAKHEE